MTDLVPIPALAGLIGALAGTDASIWGMYKDSPHEGFHWPRFFRSIVIGAVAGAAIQAFFRLQLRDPGALLVLFGLAYAAERGLVEVWKTFVREEDQSKYSIPMQFGIRGRPVKARAARLAAGAGYVAVVAACLFAISRLDRTSVISASPATMAFAGLAVGTIIAIGGAWKDAPIEGFDLLKFFRSPLLTVLFTWGLSHFTGSFLHATVAAIGFERATSENYKTFFFPTRPRGKFAGKPVTHPGMFRRRLRFVPAYAGIRVVLLVLLVMALQARREEGPSSSAPVPSGPPA